MTEVACLDHVGIVGRDLAAMLAAYRRLGFLPTQPQPLMGRDASGVAVSLGQSSAHLVFERGYVELSAVETDSPSHHLASYLGRHAGLHILAFGVDDLSAAHERCIAAGLRPRPVARASRHIGYGKRHGEAEFEWFMLEPIVAPEGLLCFVRQVTPQLVFQPEVQRHTNGGLALSGLYLVSAAAAEAASRIAAATAGALLRSATGARVELRDGWVECLDRADFQRRFPGAEPPPAPSLAGFCVRVREPHALRDSLCRSGLLVRPTGTGCWINGADAAGSLVEFAG